MSSVDDVFRYSEMLLDALVRVPPYDTTGGMGQVGSFPGLVPSTYHAARKARDDSAATLAVVKETHALLNAVNAETLGRIEAVSSSTAQVLGQLVADVDAGRAKTDQTLGRIESDLKESWNFLLTVRQDMNDLSATLDAIVEQLQQDKTDLNAKLDALGTEVLALPH